MNQPDTAPPSGPTAYPDEFFLKTLLRWYIGLIIRPAPTIREIVERGSFWAGWAAAYIAILLWFFLWGVYTGSSGLSHAQGAFGDFPPIMPSLVILFIIGFIPALSPGALVIVFHVIAKLLRGWGEVYAMYVGLLNISVVAVATGILGIAAAALLEVAGISLAYSTGPRILTPIGVATTTWMVVLIHRIVSVNYDLGLIRSGVTVLVGLAIGLPIALVVALLLMIPAFIIAFASG